MFERGKEYERGRSPLSPILPSSAINNCGFLPMVLAGEGSGVRLLPAKKMQAKPGITSSVQKKNEALKTVFSLVFRTGCSNDSRLKPA
jgi:hypothetical protein